MVEQSKPEYDEEFARRFVMTCCALDMSKARLMKLTGYKRPRINHYQKGRVPLRKPMAELSKAFRIPRLSLWLIDEDRRALDDYDKERIDHFQRLPEDQQLKRANELGWLLPHGRPRKLGN